MILWFKWFQDQSLGLWNIIKDLGTVLDESLANGFTPYLGLKKSLQVQKRPEEKEEVFTLLIIKDIAI